MEKEWYAAQKNGVNGGFAKRMEKNEWGIFR